MRFAGHRFVCSSNHKCCNIFMVTCTSPHSYHCKSHISCSANPLENHHPILESSGLQNRLKNWQHLRKCKLTASTFSQAVGFWPRRRVQLWLEKIGAIEPFYGNIATCWSNIKEEEAFERYRLITGNNDVSMIGFQVHQNKLNPEEEGWLAASPDGVIDKFIHGLPSLGVLEIKCPYFGGDMTKAWPLSRIPLYYIPQAQGLMEVLDRDWMDLYIWTTKGSSLFRLYRDEEYWKAMEKALSDFWWDHVQPAKELYSSSAITNPLAELRSLMPTPRHELCSYLVRESSRIALNDSKLILLEVDGILQKCDATLCGQ
ncbi:unnamed protein product [Cuscuta campestris]|uniref:YqaJ viral recombinase domain-containing protein n=1 Tax=Cuscuta campestris TaxID=132261 RepID=A0A484KVW6_9ASTE|nr:unnamed protein product [Cuscuta campestris]